MASARRHHQPASWRHVLAQFGPHVFGVVVVLICVSPVLLILNASFRSIATAQGFAFSWSGWTLENYTTLLQSSNMPRWVLNSLFVAGATTILTVVIDLMAAFAFAKIRFPGRNAMFMVLISTMMLPFSITLVPTYLLASRLGLIDTYWGLILPALSGPVGVYLLRQFLYGVPDALLEAARIDGASTVRIFLQIVAPLCVQPMAVLSILTFVNSWNSFLWPLLVTQSDDMRVITVGIATTHLQFSQNLGGVTAGVVISLLPMLILFFVFQRYFLQGLTAGALKG